MRITRWILSGLLAVGLVGALPKFVDDWVLPGAWVVNDRLFPPR